MEEKVLVKHVVLNAMCNVGFANHRNIKIACVGLPVGVSNFDGAKVQIIKNTAKFFDAK